MTFHNLAVLVDPKCNRPRSFRGASEPSACLLTASLLCGLKGAFGIGMRNLPAGVFGPLYGPGRKEGGLIIPARPDVVRNLCYRGGQKRLMWIHGPKGNHQVSNCCRCSISSGKQMGYCTEDQCTDLRMPRNRQHTLFLS